jgi:hypothetical protein
MSGSLTSSSLGMFDLLGTGELVMQRGKQKLDMKIVRFLFSISPLRRVRARMRSIPSGPTGTHTSTGLCVIWKLCMQGLPSGAYPVEVLMRLAETGVQKSWPSKLHISCQVISTRRAFGQDCLGRCYECLPQRTGMLHPPSRSPSRRGEEGVE